MLYIYDCIHFFATSVTVNDVILCHFRLSVWPANGEITVSGDIAVYTSMCIMSRY